MQWLKTMNNFAKTLLLTSALVFATQGYADVNTDNQNGKELPQALQEILLNSTPLEKNESYFTDLTSGDGFNINTQEKNDVNYRAELPFDKLGFPQGITMTLGQKQSGLNFTLPTDKIITKAKLELFISATESIAEKSPHFDVLLNGQELGSIVISNVETSSYELNVPSEYLAQENSLTFEIEDELSSDCKIDYTGFNEISIEGNSFLSVEGNTMEIDSDLTLFPLPFFDKYDISKGSVEFVFSKNPSKEEIKAAHMLSSFLGNKADFRGVQFKVTYDKLPHNHAIIFGKPEEKIAGMALPEKKGVYIKKNPYFYPYKVVYVVAESDVEFTSAIMQLTDPIFSPNEKLVDVSYYPIYARTLQESIAYDAPKWIPTTRKVYLRELLQPGQSMTTKGFWHNSIHLPFRTAPDLYMMYDGQGDLYVSYEFPAEKELNERESGLNVSLSGVFQDKLPVNKKGLLENMWRLFGGNARQTSRHIQVNPAYIYGENDIELYFDLRLNDSAPCTVLQNTNIKSVIDSSSYIDLSHSVHYSKLPNLSYFVGASFPFSKYADYSQTAILLPENPSESELKALFDMGARSGDATGAIISKPKILMGLNDIRQHEEELSKKDILIVSTLMNKDFLSVLFKNSAFTFNGYELNVYDYGVLNFRGGVMRGLERLFSGDFRNQNADANRYVRTSLSWRGFLSMISPFDDERIAVVVTATDDKEISKLSNDLDNPMVNRGVGGDLTIISGQDRVIKYTVGDFIYSGDVSTIYKILHFAGEHILWLAIFSVFIIMMLSLIISIFLQKRAKSRLGEDIINTKDWD